MVAGSYFLLAAGSLLAAAPAAADCDGLLPPAQTASAVRDITADDLVGLRDIGHPDAEADEASPLAVSRDGKQLAFVITRGDPQTDRVCRALVVLPTAGPPAPRIIDRGGELPIGKGVYRGIYMRSGYPDVAIPAWSPDGRWVAYIKRVGGLGQLWRARADGGGAEALLRLPVDVESFAWSPDGSRVVYTSRPAIVSGEAALDREARSGFLYDDRAVPDLGVRPNLRADDVPLVASVLDLATGAITPATAIEQDWLPPDYLPGYPIERAEADPHGWRAWTERDGINPLSPSQLWIARPDGARQPCTIAACRGRILYLWWDDGELVFLKREGWNGELTALYRWRPGAHVARRVFATEDALSGCIRGRSTIFCIRENAVTPRRLVAVDLRDGRSRLMFEPNPEFRSIRLGKVERLRVLNDRGLPAWGDLVVPPGYDGKIRLPLIVVNYFSRGFLRGGVGDEYPIYLFAAHGFAVLSFQRPPHVATAMPNVRTWDDVNKAGRADWAERSSILSAILKAVDLAVARGIADPAKVGITGLSDGATTVEYALLNSRSFAAAVTSTCCEEPTSIMAYGGPAWHDYARRVNGYPPLIDDDRAFWKPLSLGVSARELNVPLLMQLADREYLSALETFTALREAGKPVELFVYPDEYHNKWQPAHRLTLYRRNLDWFDFWLNGREDPASAKREQYVRWERLRDDMHVPVAAHARG